MVKILLTRDTLRVPQLKKLFRFFKIWGLRKTLFKVLGRSRSTLPSFVRIPAAGKRDIGVIGCGQFAFSTIGSVITKEFSNRFVDAFDINQQAKIEFSNFFSISHPSKTAADLIANEAVKYVYVVSNHRSHTGYALEALAQGKVVYVEKPLCVSKEQLAKIARALGRKPGKGYVGYNRPFSPAIKIFKEQQGSTNGPFTFNAFISGHCLGVDHWYRKQGEGNRVCGNMGHWIDLAVHLLSRSDLADQWSISVTYSDKASFDDNFTVSMGSDRGDLITITISSRHEPFEGINETICIQNEALIAHIHDFRRICIWAGEAYVEKSFGRKDVGHDLSILQPFQSNDFRKLDEILLSTNLMLHISEMVSKGEQSSKFSFRETSDWLASCVDPQGYHTGSKEA